LQWSGSTPPDPADWDTITYTYDPAGRRIKKNVVGSYIVKYVYDGGHLIAEYDVTGLLRKYIYGTRFDEPVCMIDVADSNAVYYYHFDGLGSVVALSNSNGDSCQSYEYSVYGQVAASDPNFIANPYMFTGRRFDIETGLYYYRARYYNPHIGRFMQTDAVGYGAAMNLYSFCRNNPLAFVDPSGNLPFSRDGSDVIVTNDPCDPCKPKVFDRHLDRNIFNKAYKTIDEAEKCPFFIREDNPFHWPGTYRGIGPYEGYQASYYPAPDDPWLKEHPEYAQYYDPSKAGQLDDETPLMGTYDYSPPSVDPFGHIYDDIEPHLLNDNYTPGLTTIIDSCKHGSVPSITNEDYTKMDKCPICLLPWYLCMGH